MSNVTLKAPSIGDALIPVGVLVILLSLSVELYGDESSYGANQIALILSAAVALLIGWKNGYKWQDIEQAIGEGIGKTFGAILILLTIGALIGSWILSGTVPAMIYYGLQIISPQYFYVTACLLCAITALSIGSSWSVAGTVGVGLMGISAGLGLSPEMTAGAIISGAYFGDKMSPLSDTTNLAPAVAEVDLFTHIRHMVWTTMPAIVIALVLYGIIGLMQEVPASSVDLESRLLLIEENFTIGVHMLIPLLVVFVLAMLRCPAFPTLLFAAILGAVFAVVFQQEAILRMVNQPEGSLLRNLVDGVWRTLFDGYQASTGDQSMDKLLSRGGMKNVLMTIWLIMCAITFGAIMEHLGLLQKIVHLLIRMAQTTGSLILVTALTCIGVNIIAADQYIGIVLPGRMFRATFRQRGLAAKNLSRVLEDCATVTSVLIPWNTCGAFMALTLGVATFDYGLYCFFNLICPVLSVLYGVLNIKIAPLAEEEPPKTLRPAEA
ncbi:Na+/H+ antiporter NhaC [Paremcibacter congregatus]|uniref:Na+/H+ antiporter NhaC n=1 Tax=Paremcibacter congregatus TaxID=2043170 RepID=UPI0030EF3849